jgi:hypothetical protein
MSLRRVDVYGGANVPGVLCCLGCGCCRSNIAGTAPARRATHVATRCGLKQRQTKRRMRAVNIRLYYFMFAMMYEMLKEVACAAQRAQSLLSAHGGEGGIENRSLHSNRGRGTNSECRHSDLRSSCYPVDAWHPKFLRVHRNITVDFKVDPGVVRGDLD